MDLVPARGAAPRVAIAGARFLRRVPVLFAALLCLRIAELLSGSPVDATAGERLTLALGALAVDAVDLAAGLPLLFLVSLPFLLGRTPLQRSLAVLWSLIVLAQTALVQYFLTTRVPLGADLYDYSLPEIRQTIEGGLAPNYPVLAGLVLALTCLWTGLRFVRGEAAHPSRRPLVVIAGSIVIMLMAPSPRQFPSDEALDQRNLKINTLAYFVHDSFAYFAAAPPAASPPGEAGVVAAPLDPRYPFLHEDLTPDVLGARFERTTSGRPPNLVFLIVEGLGRDFSGPGARLGSFTPYLDQLAGRSLYFENFLATQGRTFAVLPSLLGSLPFAEKGFAKLGERMPPHLTLLSVLKSQGYHLRFYTGTDVAFDDERRFLECQGVDTLVDRAQFGPGYEVANGWGFADGELLRRVQVGEHASPQPFVTVIQTETTHTPYTFPGQAAYSERFEQRLDELGVAGGVRDAYRASRPIYESLLYADDALAHYFGQAQQDPAYHDTIFVIVGDHRLPEIPMDAWIERYHVPLILFSPLLKAPARIKSISSQFDVAPSLLAYLSHEYGLSRPHQATWLGTGLDLEPAFRNVHDLPLKLSKYELVDYISGTSLLSQGRLYSLGDGLHMGRSGDDAERTRVQARFDAFRAANDSLARELVLMPPAAPEMVACHAAAVAVASALVVADVRLPDRAVPGAAVVEAVFANNGRGNAWFVPLVVLADGSGRELSEIYGAPQSLGEGASTTLKLAVKTDGVAPGDYFVSVVPSDAVTGRRVGAGRYHIPFNLQAAP